MPDRPSRTVAAVASALTACVLVAGCGFTRPTISSPLPCPTDTAAPLTLVLGARANSARPDLPPEISTLLRGATNAGSLVRVVRVDGEPGEALRRTFESSAQNETRYLDDLNAYVGQTTNLLTRIRPKQPQADVLGAVSEAARVLPEGGTLVLVDSGVPTVGPLSFTNPDMFNTNAEENVAALEAGRLLPELAGKSVVLVGLGNTAEPQAALADNHRTLVTDLWEAIAGKAGAACVHTLETSANRTSIETDVPVDTVAPAPPPKPKVCDETRLPDDDQVGFVANKATLRNPAGAKEVLTGLATQITANRLRVLLIGNTSSAGEPKDVEYNKRLAKQRSEAIKQVLVQLGVNPTAVATEGHGSKGPYYVDDRAEDGTLIPTVAAHNRSVVVRVSCPLT